MKRITILASMLIMVASVLTSCRETKEKETIVKEVEVEKKVDTPKEEREGILERTAKEVDKEVNEEINEEIEKIGDDN
ncbi:hypothetical protein NE848_06060 [Gramella jeungdoensis]|uniref:YtxH domain-containing protein n=1 Tax=Gramella jeungdoensis TaxID=708091 RepID=A0ABT0Z0K9_9FLAO|nr:hypothetical protein [Gramella jeungdoensis]MCM8568933.1 hypothetical protein [Gramella jeungdoensis]